MIKSQIDFEEELKKRFPYNKIKILKYSGASKPIEYKCLQCGRVYKKTRANHIYENKTLCQKCYSARESEIRNKFINYLNKRNDLFLLSEIKSTNEKIQIKCLKCNRIFKVLMSNFVSSNDHSCPYCGKNGSFVDEREFLNRIKKAGFKDYEIIKYKNFMNSVTFKHNKCGKIFTQLPGNFLKGRGCPHCYKKISKGEQKIIDFLNKNNISFIYQKKFKELGNKSYDFYLNDYNVLIEYQGEQHYQPCNYYGGEENFKKQVENDNKKRIFASQNKIKLLEIPYTEINNIEIILSKLIGSTTIPVVE